MAENQDNELLEIMSKHMGSEWASRLKNVLLGKEFSDLYDFLEIERSHHTVYPVDSETIFKAFRLTPFSQVRVVILGQDPYHDGSADGLAFSNSGKSRPSPSLRNIFKEIEDTVYEGLQVDQDLDLSRWAKQGVLLLNTALTVRKGIPDSHKQAWYFFIRAVFEALADGHTGLVYMVWGKNAMRYEPLITHISNHILVASHPVVSVYGGSGFFGCDHFRKTNNILKGMNNVTIQW